MKEKINIESIDLLSADKEEDKKMYEVLVKVIKHCIFNYLEKKEEILKNAGLKENMVEFSYPEFLGLMMELVYKTTQLTIAEVTAEMLKDER